MKFNECVLKARAIGIPSGQIEPQPRDTHFSQGTWDEDMVRMGNNKQETGQRPHLGRCQRR